MLIFCMLFGFVNLRLLGSITLEKECRDRDLVPGSLNDHTFLFEMDQAKFIIDARKCGNIHTKYLRRYSCLLYIDI